MAIRRFTDGVGTKSAGTATGMLGMPDPTKYHTYFEDFDYYTAGDWTVTNSGTATEALTDEDGGVLLLTHDATTDDNTCFLQKPGESFTFESGKKLWYKARFKHSDATQSDILFGLVVTDTTPLTNANGVYFQKDDGDALIDFHVTEDSTTSSLTGIGTLVDATYIVLGFYYDGVSKIYVYVNDTEVGQVTTTTTMPTTELKISFATQTGDAVGTKTMSVDYVFACKER